MTRNRKRAKLKSKEPCASELKQFEPVAHSVVIESESDELMKAWTCVMVLILEQYLKRTNKHIANMLKLQRNLTPANSSKRLILNLGIAQNLLLEQIDELEDCKRVAKETFTSNVAQLSRGVPFERLPLIDNKRSLKILEEMISRQTDPDNDDVSLYASGDSAIEEASSNDADVVCDENMALFSTALCDRKQSMDVSELHQPLGEAPEVDLKKVQSEGIFVDITESANERPDCKTTATVTDVDAEDNYTICNAMEQQGCDSKECQNSTLTLLDTSAVPPTVTSELSLDCQDLVTVSTSQNCLEKSISYNDPVFSCKETLSLSTHKMIDNTPHVATELVVSTFSTTTADLTDEIFEDTGSDWQTIIKKKKPDKVAKPLSLTSPQMPTNAVSVTPWDNSKFKGERGEQRRKTEICKNFKLGICKWEADCNYAHSESERMEARKRQASGDKQLAGGIVTSSVTKHSTAIMDLNPSANVTSKSSKREIMRKTEWCDNYRQGTCSWGKECNYAHSETELRLAKARREEQLRGQGAHGAIFPDPSPAANLKFKNGYKLRKSEMCENFRLGKCKWGSECNYAHSVEELLGTIGHFQVMNYAAVNNAANNVDQSTRPKQPAVNFNGKKLLMCKSFELNKCRRPSSECKYAHHADELDQAFQHKEPCDHQQCAGRLRYERRKTIMCRDLVLNGDCQFGADCTYAHNTSELRPLPKHELCQRHKKGRCAADECVYAHSVNELRPKTPERAPPKGIDQNHLQSTAAFSHLPLSWKDEFGMHADDVTSVDEGCIICFEPLSDKIDLECGHDKWHFKCISKWLNERRPQCPLCNQPAQLPDLFQAPAGLNPRDFPALQY